ncbi:MAG: hypothetical protein ACRDY5_06240, partial [Acidimicrobiales bacterium]
MRRRIGVQSLVDPSQQRANATGLMVPANLGPAPFHPSQPQGAGPNRRIILPGCNYPPADAIPVDQIGEADIAFGASATLNTIIVPGMLTLRIAGIGFGADDESGLRFLSWSLFATPPAGTITPYVNMPAAIGTIVQLSTVFVVAGSSVIIT